MERTCDASSGRRAILGHRLKGSCSVSMALAASVLFFTIPAAFAQKPDGLPNPAVRAQAQVQQQIQQDKAGYAAAIVARWQDAARASGKWDSNYATDLFGALMKLGPENLQAAGEATSYEAMAEVLMAGSLAQAPQSLGDFAADLVYTPVTPCRIVDTRNAGGIIAASATRSFDVDNTTSFASQGGFAGPCGIPFGVASAVAMNITVTQPTGGGFLTAWAVGSAQPVASIINFVAGETIANSTVVPVLPGGGNDFFIFAGGSASHVVIDVLGYFAAPVATALQCQFSSPLATQTVANGGTINFSPNACPAGFTAVSLTCHGQDSFAGTNWSSFGITTTGSQHCQGTNNSGASQTYNAAFTCCRVPGR